MENIMKLFALFFLFAPLSSMAFSDVTRNPSPVIKVLANGMTLLKPVFSLEAKFQASLLGSISKVDEQAISQEIATEVTSSPVVIYTYGLSPFSSEAVSILESTGCDFKTIEVGAEWFLLDGNNSVKRVLLSEFVDNGATSLPKVFVNGECIGGCAELAISATSCTMRSFCLLAIVAVASATSVPIYADHTATGGTNAMAGNNHIDHTNAPAIGGVSPVDHPLVCDTVMHATGNVRQLRLGQQVPGQGAQWCNTETCTNAGITKKYDILDCGDINDWLGADASDAVNWSIGNCDDKVSCAWTDGATDTSDAGVFRMVTTVTRAAMGAMDSPDGPLAGHKCHVQPGATGATHSCHCLCKLA